MESLVDVNGRLYKSTFQLPENDILRIKETVKQCIMKIPPYLSIVEVKLDRNRTYGESLYLCENKLSEVIEKINQDIYNGDEIHDITDFISEKNATFSFQRERYYNGISFCKIFLKEYFKEDLNKFEEIQELDKNINNKEKNKKDDYERDM